MTVETKGPAIGIPAERLVVAVYAVGAQCHVAGLVISLFFPMHSISILI